MPQSDAEGKVFLRSCTTEFKTTSYERFDQLCLKYDIKGSQRDEFVAFIQTHHECIHDLVKLIEGYIDGQSARL